MKDEPIDRITRFEGHDIEAELARAAISPTAGIYLPPCVACGLDLATKDLLDTSTLVYCPNCTTTPMAESEFEQLVERQVHKASHVCTEVCVDKDLTGWQEDAKLAILAANTASVTAIAKAYGGCTKCYGKGYASYASAESGYGTDGDIGGYEGRYYRTFNEMRYCTCDRGKQLERYVTASVNEQAEKALKLPVGYALISHPNGKWTARWEPKVPTDGLPPWVAVHAHTSPLTAVSRLKAALIEADVIKENTHAD